MRYDCNGEKIAETYNLQAKETKNFLSFTDNNKQSRIKPVDWPITSTDFTP